jgi:hypothetical protein
VSYDDAANTVTTEWPDGDQPTYEMTVSNDTLTATVVNAEGRPASEFPEFTYVATSKSPAEATDCTSGTDDDTPFTWTGNWNVVAYDGEDVSGEAHRITLDTWSGVFEKQDGTCGAFSDPVINSTDNTITTSRDDGLVPTYEMSVSDGTLTATVVNVDGGSTSDLPDITLETTSSSPSEAVSCTK